MTDSSPALDQTLVDILAVNGAASSSLRARFTSPEITQYLSHVTSLNLSEIQQEPVALSSEAAQLTNSLTTLCTAEYPTFLALHRTSAVLASTLSEFSSSLSSLTSTLPSLESHARQFSQDTRGVLDTRTKARLVLKQHDALVDVLDIPQLIDTCVRNAYYQEAMDLSAHASRLAERFPDIPLVQGVAAEAAHAMRLMLAQLLSLLREPAKLPALFKAVSFLRKMDALEELELAVVFLSSRLANLTSILDGIENDGSDHARYIRRYVDAWREGVYDIATQFNTIFLDRKPSEKLAHELQYLLSTLLHHMLSALLAILGDNLSKVEDATSLASLLTQLTHCSNSFSRIGLDFRSLLPILFEDAIQVKFAKSLDEATNKFLVKLSDAQKYSRQPSQVLITSTSALSPPDDTSLPDSPHIPPHVLTSYPPLALLTNGILAALNSLRLLAPVTLLNPLLAKLDTALAKAASSFLVYCQVPLEGTGAKAFNVGEEAPDQSHIMKTAGKIFVNVLVPYARRALIKGVYSASDDLILAMQSDLRDCLSEWDNWLTESKSKKFS